MTSTYEQFTDYLIYLQGAEQYIEGYGFVDTGFAQAMAHLNYYDAAFEIDVLFGYVPPSWESLGSLDRLVIAADGAGNPPENEIFEELAKLAGATTDDPDNSTYNGRAVFGIPQRRIRRYIDRVLMVNPDAEIYLMGYSAGGHGVIRLAGRLHRDGIGVQGMVLFDPHNGRRPFGHGSYELPGNVEGLFVVYQQNPARIGPFKPQGNSFQGGSVSCGSCPTNRNYPHNLTGITDQNGNLAAIHGLSIVTYGSNQYGAEIREILGL